MPRPIDGDALTDELQRLEDKLYKKAADDVDFQAAYISGIVHGINKRVQAASTLDYAPVRHGEWIKKSYKCAGETIYGYKCNNCGRVELSEEPFCHCGTKMDGGKKDG